MIILKIQKSPGNHLDLPGDFADFVGVTGFEPATTWSQTRCATGLRYAPKGNGWTAELSLPAVSFCKVNNLLLNAQV